MPTGGAGVIPVFASLLQKLLMQNSHKSIGGRLLSERSAFMCMQHARRYVLFAEPYFRVVVLFMSLNSCIV